MSCTKSRFATTPSRSAQACPNVHGEREIAQDRQISASDWPRQLSPRHQNQPTFLQAAPTPFFLFPPCRHTPFLSIFSFATANSSLKQRQHTVILSSKLHAQIPYAWPRIPFLALPHQSVLTLLPFSSVQISECYVLAISIYQL